MNTEYVKIFNDIPVDRNSSRKILWPFEKKQSNVTVKIKFPVVVESSGRENSKWGYVLSLFLPTPLLERPNQAHFQIL
jgi:hypothetical protein